MTTTRSLLFLSKALRPLEGWEALRARRNAAQKQKCLAPKGLPQFGRERRCLCPSGASSPAIATSALLTPQTEAIVEHVSFPEVPLIILGFPVDGDHLLLKHS